ncbi:MULTISPECIES: hypothetical protein [Rhizobium]|uniref:Uncharacterized protein n=1 Tax=Rhizobium leguminosarum TaxID=384 RepID=A0A7K3VSL0_RHILE|nr:MULTISPECIES: hypothetical protein [Rhizobium]NEK19874.1 hypothetical protein [Rhizobium leguminosarum]TAV04507.1 hypothetical protein ELI39_03980 [Rhizobium ruizarguesonis]
MELEFGPLTLSSSIAQQRLRAVKFPCRRSSTLLVCKDEPRYTGRPNVSAADLLEFTDKVAIAGAECRAKLRAVKKIVEQK